MNSAILILLLRIFLQSGCRGGPAALMSLITLDPVHNHGKIAAYNRSF